MIKKISKAIFFSLALILSAATFWLTVFDQNSEIAKKNLAKTEIAKRKPKADKPDEFLKLYNSLRTRANETEPGYSSGYKLKALRTAQQTVASMRLSATYNFIERGPGNVPGRTRALIIDPDDANHSTWFAGGVGGGIWKTTDGGQSWVNKTETLPNLAISWLAMADSDHNIIYAGTGEGWGSSTGFIKGSGIYKSIDK